jgi:hypothetical protein
VTKTRVKRELHVDNGAARLSLSPERFEIRGNPYSFKNEEHEEEEDDGHEGQE